jgi:glycosyltransferase involved in cell wall biosynthesis
VLIINILLILVGNELSKTKTNRLEKPIIFVTLAVSFFIDPRVKQEVASFVKNNYFVHILSWDREGKFLSKQYENYSVKMVKLLQAQTFSKILFMLSAVLFQFTIFLEGVKLLGKHRKMIIHANDFNTLLGVVLLKRVFPRKVKIVYDCHELTPAVYGEWYGQLLGKIIGKLEIAFVKHVDEIISVSPPIVDYLKSIAKQKVTMIWNYPTKTVLPDVTKQQARKQLGIDSDIFLITYTGSLRIDVALQELVLAIDHLVHSKKVISDSQKIQVVIVGDGPFLEPLQKIVKEKRLDQNVKLMGRVEREKSLLYLRAANLSYILFTVKGLNTKIGMPWKLFESLVSETKVLVVDNTYAAEMITKQKAGYTVKKIDIIAIADLIVKAMKEKDKMNNDFRKQFVWESQEKDFISVYDSLI